MIWSSRKDHDRTPPLAVTSMNRQDWVEDPAEDAERNGLLHAMKRDDPEGNARLLRRYYPLKAKMLKSEDVLGFQPGTVLKYARVRRSPSRYPIEVYFTGKTASGSYTTRRIGFDSSEVQVIPADA